jgi:hypothetical protein
MLRGRGLAVALLIAVLAGAFATGPASSVELSMVCSASGNADVKKGSGATWAWTMEVFGSCAWGHKTIPIWAQGKGTSQGCGEILRNLSLKVTNVIQYHGLPGFDLTFSDVWKAGRTTYPGVTPFVVAEGGKNVGAGTFIAHLVNQCPGKPIARVAWTRTMPVAAPIGAITCTASGSLYIYRGHLYGAINTWDFQGDATCRRTGGGPEVWTGPIHAIGGNDSLFPCEANPSTSWIPWQVFLDLAETSTGSQVDAFDNWDVVGHPGPGTFILFEQGILTADPAAGCWALASTRAADVAWDMSF